MTIRCCVNTGLFILLICICSVKTHAKENIAHNNRQLYFIENSGQLRDQYNNPRRDIQFALQGGGVNVFVGNGQLHYQFLDKEVCPAGPTSGAAKGNNGLVLKANVLAAQMHTYRLDEELVGANKDARAITGDIQSYYENYFLSYGDKSEITAHTFNRVIYKDIYPHIDWVLYIKNNKLEYDFIINPGGNVSDIQIRYNGASHINVGHGSLLISTPFGNISETSLHAYNAVTGQPITTYFKLENNLLCFSMQDSIGVKNAATVIDPVLEWGTYYGPDTSSSPLYAAASDGNGNIYACGMTYSGITANIATVGSYQYTYGGNQDAYLVKFDSSGHRLWATYYGGSGQDWGQAVTCDHFGNVYMGGFTSSVDSIATPGAQQPAIGGSGATNGLLVKFDSSGHRIWATYYGGDQADIINSVVCDDNMHVYIAGSASSTFNIATPGTFEPVFVNPGNQYVEGFLAQFDTAGVRQWGTYYEAYNGTMIDNVYSFQACTDGINVFVGAWTDGADSVATAGSWQPGFGGVTDALVAKFDNLGNRLWATFYGGPQQEVTGSIACDKTGYVYLMGATTSDAAIASPGCAQPARAGLADAFLVQFDPVTGTRNWGTYYGGPANEDVASSTIATNSAGNVYIIGGTESLTGIASAGAWQSAYGGGDMDAFLAEYDISGTQLWSTYYGGAGTDIACGCAFDGRNVYLCGQTSSANNIATPGSFDASYDGDSLYNKGFLAKFAPPGPGPILGPDSICLGDSTIFTNDFSGGSWSSSDTLIATINSVTGLLSAIDTGVDTVTYLLPAGNFAVATLHILPSPGPVIGDTYLCFDSALVFYDSTTGGLWSSSAASIATIGSVTGIVNAIAGGATVIFYTLPNGCSALSYDTVHYCWPAGIPAATVNQADAVFPNPAYNEVTITSNDQVNLISITTLTGLVVYEHCYYSSRCIIDISNFIPDIYIVIVNGRVLSKLDKPY